MAERQLVRDDEHEPPQVRVKKAIPKAELEPVKREKRLAVVKKAARKRKKSLGAKFRETFLGEGDSSIGSYILHDVLVPAFKSTVTDMVTGGIETLVYGERRSTRGRTFRQGGKSYVSYAGYYDRDRGRDREERRELSRGRSRHDFDEVEFDSRADAEEVLQSMVDSLFDYNMVLVAELYELSRLPTEYTDENYGWTDLRGAYASRKRNGMWVLNLPTPVPLK